MIRILQIETSTSMCSVAISEDGQTAVCVEKNEANIHGAQLLPMIDEALAELKITFDDLSAIAVSKGPGSYTGLRIGVASAKGLCYGLNIPLISVPTLQSFSELVVKKSTTSKFLCPMLDARRMEVYTARFDRDTNYVEKESARILDDDFFNSFDANEAWCFFGPGMNKASEFISKKENWKMIDDQWPSAKGMSKLAFEAFKEKRFEDIAYYEPFYLKDFVATTPKKNIL
ncbi:MAG: tRNA (adenosine(37)-N6)-threonylcarbamoyltransferase complex dimerization subunit type 1 TsaB [Bacteroidia bacterium]|nr:tRNA (adenosine(37)-N6)-threonylcarbamoyltransferase complex dimerization subunit type 1 TsaB [Bacteroidia bacterium]